MTEAEAAVVDIDVDGRVIVAVEMMVLEGMVVLQLSFEERG